MNSSKYQELFMGSLFDTFPNWQQQQDTEVSIRME